MTNPIAHNDSAPSATGPVFKGKDKAAQGSLFAKLMAVFGQKIEADAKGDAKGDGKVDGKAGKADAKAVTIIDAKALAKQQKHAGSAEKNDKKNHAESHHSRSKDHQGADGVAVAAHQHLQHQEDVKAKSAADNGDAASQDALARNGKAKGFSLAEGKQAAVKAGQHDADATVGKGAGKGREQEEAGDVAKASERSQTQSKQASTTAKSDAGKTTDHPEPGIEAQRAGDSAPATAKEGETDAASMKAKSNAASLHHSDTKMEASDVTASAGEGRQARSASAGDSMKRSAQAAQEAGSGAKQDGREAADSAQRAASVTVAKGTAKASTKPSAGTAQARPDFHPTGEAAMQQAAVDEAAAAQPKKSFETASAKGKKHDKHADATVQSQQMGKQSAAAAAGQAHAMPRNAQEMAAATANANVTARQDEAGTGNMTGQQQQLQNSGNTPFPVHGVDMSASASIPRAYAGAQAGAHTSGPWTAMLAMQEVGHQAAQGKTRIELKLEPAHLGKVQVFLESDSRKHIQVHMVVEQAASRQVIEQHLPSLRQTLEQHGLNLGDFSMSSQNQQQGGTDNGGQQQRFTSSVLENRGAASIAPSSVQASAARATLPGDSRLSIHI